MEAILSDTELVVLIRQPAFQQLVVQLQSNPQGAIKAHSESASALAFIRRLSAGIERVRGAVAHGGGGGAKL
eukprot:SAG11_NODE_1516_length_4766_cov_1.916006_5_plen_72_part_00